MALLNAVSAIIFLPETHHHRTSKEAPGFNPLRPLKKAAEDGPLRPLYLTWLMFALAFVTGQSVFALFAKDVFGFTAFQAGLAFTVVGVVVVLNQTLLLNRFWLARYSEQQLISIMLVILAVALLCIASEILLLFFVGLVGLGTGQAVLRVVVTSEVSGAGGQERKGETIGILSALMSGAMVVAPVVAGALFEIDHAVPYFFAVLFLLAGLVFIRQLPDRATTNP